MCKAKAISIDLDGTLVDSEWAFFESSKYALRQVGLKLSVESFREECLNEGRCSLYLARSILSDLDFLALKNLRDKNYFERLAQVRLLPGISILLSELAARHSLWIVTGSTRAVAEKLLLSKGIHRYFYGIISVENYAQPKPDPSSFKAVIEAAASCDQEVFLAIEDSIRGVRAAKAAGLSTVWLKDPRFYPGNCHSIHASMVFETARDLSRDLWRIIN